MKSEELRQIYKAEDTSDKTFIPARPKANPNEKDRFFKVCAYCRVSTDNDEQLSSFELQQAHYKQLVKYSRIHIFIEALRAIGHPSRICFLIDKSGDTLLIVPHEVRDFKSHRIPKDVYSGTRGMCVNSYKLCHIIAKLHGWDSTHTYRVPGKVHTGQRYAIFYLNAAEMLK